MNKGRMDGFEANTRFTSAETAVEFRRDGGINRQLWVGVFLLGVLSAGAVLALTFHDFSINPDMLQRLLPPSGHHWLGTGPLGRDVVSCIIAGTGISLLISVVVVLVSTVTGGLAGIAAAAAREFGSAGKVADSVLTGIADILLAFPGLILAIGLAAFMQGGAASLILALVIPGWAPYARMSRANALQYNSSLFIKAARGYNAGFSGIVRRHMLPAALPMLAVQASLDMPGIIIAESGLNFLGIGLDPAIPTLGQLVDVGRAHLFDQPVLVIAPGLVLLVMLTAFYLIGESLKINFCGTNT